MRNVLTVLFSLIVASAVLVSDVRAQEVRSIAFVEAGIFTGRNQGREPSPKTATGMINIVSDRKLVEATDRICARLGVFFGVTFIVNGAPNGTPVTLDLVTRFPPGGMINAKGQRFEQNEFTSSAIIGERSVRTFSFDEVWEMVPGTWLFEFHHKGRKIGETAFQVMTTCEIS